MNYFSISDLMILRAVHGWIELGNYAEAGLEIKNLSLPAQSHPEVLKVNWQILYQLRDWVSCLEVAQTRISAAPNDPGSREDLMATLAAMNEGANLKMVLS